MFGLVRRKRLDAVIADRDSLDAQLFDTQCDLYASQSDVSGVLSLCSRGGVELDSEDTATTAVAKLVARVYAAASEVSGKEKLNQFNRGMLAEREAAKSRHSAA